MKDDRLYLIHIQECIQRIEAYTGGGEDQFFSDEKTQDAVLRNLQTLAESSQRLSDDLKKQHSGIDWKSISGFRNVVVHDYLGIDVHQIWDIVKNDLSD
ncbi:MAG: DUF86 domain-containing protein, partial [Deltaproteobacteria bacterium]|nr:DUF86 domain-containing protein [Deltaproteobacteria bacterium]